MGRKRGRTRSQIEALPKAKKPKLNFTWTDLPVEIHEVILNYAIPDARDMIAVGDRKATAKMYTTPILQTSRFYRRLGLAIINRRIVWIRIKFHDSNAIRRLPFDLLRNLPIVPNHLQNLIPFDAPMINIELDDEGVPSRRGLRSSTVNEYILPYNMGTLISFCESVTSAALDFCIGKVTLRYENMTEYGWHELAHGIIPALTLLWGLEDVDIYPELTDFCPERDPGFGPVNDWDLLNIWDKANDALRRVDGLEKLGRYEEAGLFLLSHDWLVDEAAELLPSAMDWELGEVDPWAPENWGMIIELPGRCPRGNQLRNFLFKMEYKACLAYAHFLVEYGPEWCELHKWCMRMKWFNKPYCTATDIRFFEDPAFTWFGIGDRERAQLHHGRAVLFAAIAQARKKYKKYFSSITFLEGTSTNHLELAAVQMWFAHFIEPENPEWKTLYDQYKVKLGKRAQEKVEQGCNDRAFVHLLEPKFTGGPRSIWAGDVQMVDDWGGDQYLDYLPLAQKIPEKTRDEEVEEWKNSHPGAYEQVQQALNRLFAQA